MKIHAMFKPNKLHPFNNDSLPYKQKQKKRPKPVEIDINNKNWEVNVIFQSRRKYGRF